MPKSLVKKAKSIFAIAGFSLTLALAPLAQASSQFSATYMPMQNYTNYNVANNAPVQNDCSGTPATFQNVPVIYVNGNSGNDSSTTGNYANPYKTLIHAASVVAERDADYASGQLVCAETGTYAPFIINTSGANYNNIIRFEVVPGNTATVDLTTMVNNSYQYGGITIGPVHYVLVSGFYVHGPDDTISGSPNGWANVTSSSNEGTAYYSSNCIQVLGEQLNQYVPNSEADHIYIIGNNVEGCPGAGIATVFADYVTIDDNTVSNCAWYSVYGTSGISMLDDYDTNPSDKSNPYVYKDYVINNTVFNNTEYLPWTGDPNGASISDGEGIIIDTNLNSDAYGVEFGTGSNQQYVSRYTGYTLVENNVVYDNGSAAIETVASENVDIMYNTLFNNDLNYRVCPTPPNGCFEGEQGKGEVFLVDSINLNVGDNILYSSIYDVGAMQLTSSSWGNYAPSNGYVTTALLTPNFFQNLGYNPWSLGNNFQDGPNQPSVYGSNGGNNGGNPGFNSGYAWANSATVGDEAAGEQATALSSVNLTIPTTTSTLIQNGWNYLMLPTDRNGATRVATYQTYSVGAYYVPY